ncbi:hypothetical protein [Bacillus sp. Marseille-Q1617]|uniref:hypothetical protein n=1 Tax=Bacillus sp. Marseille-Q1617 TaxID=2736887 RepID=UPI00158D2F87|nr:hypothetical protein [Bacillus sp. Marseille-Q1617]
MQKENWQGLMIIGWVAAAAGGMMLFLSGKFGLAAGERWLADRGGADTGLYHLVIEGYIHAFLAAGSIFLSFGLILIVLTYYKIRMFKSEEGGSGG